MTMPITQVENLEDSTPETVTAMPATPSTPVKSKKKKKVVLLVILVFLVLILTIAAALAFYSWSIVSKLQTQGIDAKTSAQNAYSNFKSQNLPAAEAELKKLEGQVATLKKDYQQLSFYKFVPLVGAYYRDGEHGLNAAQAGIAAGLKGVEAIVPYADVLGFSGEGSFEGGTAENRIKLILETLEKVAPQLDSIQGDLNKLNEELAAINENRYPEKIKELEVRKQIAGAKSLAQSASKVLADYRPFIEKLPEIAGATGQRKKYLVLFQNDNELRPTGGFLTAYSVIYIEDGKVTPEKSDDIYELDKKFNKRIPIPAELGRYLTTEKYWNLRDMNIDPDFKKSMTQFFTNYSLLKGEPDKIDGIIAVDTELLTDLVKIVGPVEVAGYGTFTAENDQRCDCPQIIYALSEIITKPTPYLRADRKGILAPLMQTILQKIYASPRVYMADLFTVGIKSMEGRHVQMNFFDENTQLAIEKINAAGRLQNRSSAQDFLAIVNANLGGAKSNLFTNYEVLQTVAAPQDGMIEKSVEISYKNNRKADNCNLEAGKLCLNSTLRDWTRIYLPKGSQLISAQGFNEDAKSYDTEDFTVIDGFFILEPLGSAKIKISYKVPYTDSNYKLQIWKQGGITEIPMIIDVTGGQEEILVNKDTLYETEF